ncbi:Pirin-related protein [Pseudomonas syringae pv. broussonetiae]|uniref:Pirin-related protein n=1 Tax=Pseudomonas savastanoi TaxID=29438 RepID=A0A3M5B4D5_PSESS|nr:Pirin-related protein [Pseudomonas syringae pv. broussonetiae]RMS20300.1 Pirin-related protein [Pseudomonas savastanoi]RMT26234.1 Pirin-related protein [Pseudomonas savastanoi]
MDESKPTIPTNQVIHRGLFFVLRHQGLEDNAMNTIVSIQPRAITHRTSGKSRGPITRLMSPGDLGQLLKPFVFLDQFDFKPEPAKKRLRHASTLRNCNADLYDRRRNGLRRHHR